MVHASIIRYSEKFGEQLHRHNYVTPKHFLDYTNKYLELLKERKKHIVEQHQRFDGGLKVKQVEQILDFDR